MLLLALASAALLLLAVGMKTMQQGLAQGKKMEGPAQGKKMEAPAQGKKMEGPAAQRGK
jgi:hypothetical protein